PTGPLPSDVRRPRPRTQLDVHDVPLAGGLRSGRARHPGPAAQHRRGPRRTERAQARHGPQRRDAAHRGRPPNLRGPCRRAIARLRTSARPADGPALFPVLTRPMLELTVRLPPDPSDCSATMTLPFDQRQKSRFRGQLDRGDEVAVLLPRGTVLRDGDILTTELGYPKVRVIAAPELLSVVRDDDPH